MTKKVSAAVEELLQPIADSMGLIFVDVEFVREDESLFLRVYIDRVPEGVDLDTCETFHRRIIPVLDDVEYDFLEVSSPGDRPLKKPADFLRLAGREVEVRLYAPRDGKKRYVGTLIEGNSQHIVLSADKKTVEFSRGEVALVKPFFRP